MDSLTDVYTDPQIHCTRGVYPSSAYIDRPGCLATVSPQILHPAPGAVPATAAASATPQRGQSRQTGDAGKHKGCGTQRVPTGGPVDAGAWSITGSQGTPLAAPMGGGAGCGGENTVSSSHEEATDIHGGGSTMRLGSPKSPASPAPAEQSLLSLLFKKKRQFFFRRPPAKWGFGWAGAGKGAQLCPRSPARTPSLPPSKGILQLQHGMGSLASPLPKTTRAPNPTPRWPEPGLGVSFPSSPLLQPPPQQQGFSPYQKKVNIVQSKGREGLRCPPGPLGCAGATAQFRAGAGRHLPSDGRLEEGLSRTRPGHRPAGGRRTDTKAGQRAGAKVPCGVSLPLELVQSWSLCLGGFPLSSHPQPDFAVTVQPAPGARNAPGGGPTVAPPALPTAGWLLATTHPWQRRPWGRARTTEKRVQ